MPDEANQRRKPAACINKTNRWYEHEVRDFIRNLCRANTSTPALEPLPVPEVPTLIGPREVKRLTGLTSWSIWDRERKGVFPKRVVLPAGELDQD